MGRCPDTEKTYGVKALGSCGPLYGWFAGDPFPQGHDNINQYHLTLMHIIIPKWHNLRFNLRGAGQTGQITTPLSASLVAHDVSLWLYKWGFSIV